MKSEVWIALIVAIPPTIAAIGAMIVQIYNARKAAVKVEEVKEVLADTTEKNVERLNEIAKVGVETHTLVNGAMSAQLRLTATFARELATSRGLPADVKAAELAEKALEEHEAKQPKSLASSVIPGDSTMKRQ